MKFDLASTAVPAFGAAGIAEGEVSPLLPSSGRSWIGPRRSFIAGARPVSISLRQSHLKGSLGSQCAAEKAGIVRDDAVDAVLRETLNVRGIVDGPDDHFLAGTFYFAD